MRHFEILFLKFKHYMRERERERERENSFTKLKIMVVNISRPVRIIL